jgi:Pentose-5-phosphate-3-epimerase
VVKKFLEFQLKKIESIRNKITKAGLDIDLEVDGGINAETAQLAKQAGANVLVAGSAVFKGDASQYKNNIEALR